MSKFQFGDKVTHPVYGHGIFLRLWPKDKKFYYYEHYNDDICSVSFESYPKNNEVTEWIKVGDLSHSECHTKIHPMSEEPGLKNLSEDTFYLINGKRIPIYEMKINREDSLCFYFVRHLSWTWQNWDDIKYMILSLRDKPTGWLSESELSQLIKDNTAP